jgi:xylulose-5-phosphate/fructose-6-phosphate phosphoketolase
LRGPAPRYIRIRAKSGKQRFSEQFSFPGGIGSHATPQAPGGIHEGGELGYSISHAFGTVFDGPDLITRVLIGDREFETGPFATSWHNKKLLSRITDGAVLPVLHLNGYKINKANVMARMSHVELEALFVGYGYTIASELNTHTTAFFDARGCFL